MAEFRIRLATLILVLYPVAVLATGAWIATVAVRQWRLATDDKRELKSRIRDASIGWVALTCLLVAFWVLWANWVGMGISHGPDDVAPIWLIIVITVGVVGYVALCSALRRRITSENERIST